MIGKINSYNSEKGYGFISSDEGNIFFHISDVKEGLPCYGMDSTFEIEITSKGKKAINIIIESNNIKSQFISVGGERIRGKNISEYKVLHYSKEYILNLINDVKRLDNLKGSVSYDFQDGLLKASVSQRFEELGVDDLNKECIKELINVNEINVICIKTYQSKEYRFCEGIHVEDVNAEIRKLDEYFE